MSSAVLYTLASVAIVSAISLIGIMTLMFSGNAIKRMIFLLVSFSAGALFGDVFIHLIPQASENGFPLEAAIYLIVGIFSFFALEQLMHWRHCHLPTTANHPHPLGMVNIVGDAFHNMIDGMLIAGSYMASVPLGVTTTIAVVAHEIPQEIGDFGILLHAGYTRAKALAFNFLSALAAAIGAGLTLYFGTISAGQLTTILIPFTAGGFIYIAGSDLLPELKKECEIWKSLLQLIGIFAGVAVMIMLLALE